MTETDTPKKKNQIVNIALLVFKVITKITSFSVKLTKLALVGISLVAYSYLFTWKFAIILIVQLLIHEYGHVFAMKKVGIKTKGIYLIPFVGGAAVASEDFKTRRDEVFVALMGPVFGFGCAFAMLLIYLATNEPMYAAGASWMAMINLFNLLPINPLDGGRVMKSIAFSLHSLVGFVFMGIGILCSVFLALFAHMWIFILVIIISSIELSLEVFYFNKTKKVIKETIEIKNNSIQFLTDAAKKDGLSEQQINEIIEPLNSIEIEEEMEMKPSMTGKEMIISTLVYFALAFLLFWFMVSTMHIPGAAMALEMLQ